MSPKICIYGAGAIGCHLAGHLARTGNAEVSVVAHEQTVSAILKNGIRVITPAEDFTVQVTASTDAATLGIQDYVIVALKIQQLTDAVLTEIQHLIGPNTTILPPSTGIPYYFFHKLPGPHNDEKLPEIDPDGRQWQLLPPSQVIPVTFWVATHRPAPWITQQDGKSARYAVGELDGSQSERLKVLADLMEAGGLDVIVTNNIRGEIWTKFANSLCGNPIAVLTLSDMNGFASSPGVLKVFETMLNEVDAVGKTLGITAPRTVAERIHFTLSTGDHEFSMLQDLESGRPLELDAFTGSWAAVKRLVDSASTPTCDIVLPLVELRNRRYQKQLHAV